jgi:glutamate receptor, ionotropic, invertebrate
LFLHRAPLWGFLVNGTNDTYNGILGMFKKKQIELSISPFLVTLDRLEFIDYTVVTWTTTPTVVFRHPQIGLRNIFLQPLSSWVWRLILVVIFVVSILITVTVKLHRNRVRNITFIRSLITTIAILCQQGFIGSFRKLSTRIVLLTSILFSLIIYQFYSSYIVSSLLTAPPKTINSLRQLIDSDLEVGMENASYAAYIFENANDSLTTELYQNKILKKNHIMSAEDGLKLMKKGGFAFNVDTSYAYQILKSSLTDEEVCELHEVFIKALIPKRPLRPAVIKKSPFKKFFIIGLMRLRESGIIDYHSQRWSATKPKCVKSEAKVKKVAMKEISIIFLFLGIAVLVSFGILVGEIVHFRCVHQKKKEENLRIAKPKTKKKLRSRR